MKKILSIMACMAMVLTCGIALVACGSSKLSVTTNKSTYMVGDEFSESDLTVKYGKTNVSMIDFTDTSSTSAGYYALATLDANTQVALGDTFATAGAYTVTVYYYPDGVSTKESNVKTTTYKITVNEAEEEDSKLSVSGQTTSFDLGNKFEDESLTVSYDGTALSVATESEAGYVLTATLGDTTVAYGEGLNIAGTYVVTVTYYANSISDTDNVETTTYEIVVAVKTVETESLETYFENYTLTFSNYTFTCTEEDEDGVWTLTGHVQYVEEEDADAGVTATKESSESVESLDLSSYTMVFTESYVGTEDSSDDYELTYYVYNGKIYVASVETDEGGVTTTTYVELSKDDEYYSDFMDSLYTSVMFGQGYMTNYLFTVDEFTLTQTQTGEVEVYELSCEKDGYSYSIVMTFEDGALVSIECDGENDTESSIMELSASSEDVEIPTKISDVKEPVEE